MRAEELKIAFVGMGEAGSAIVDGWGTARAAQVRAYDIKLQNQDTCTEIVERCRALHIQSCNSMVDAVADADLVFSCVTPDQAVAVAREAAGKLRPGAVWCDLNSCAPSSKIQAAQLIENGGGQYLDVAVMSPVHPRKHQVPLLVSGNQADQFAPIFEALPLNARVIDGPVGRASSIKMVRSIMVKGLEALTAECALAAVAAGVEDDVFPSLKSGHPNIDVAERSAYNFERSLAHGERRAAEMNEVAKMPTDLQLPNVMSLAAAHWQNLIASQRDIVPPEALKEEFSVLAARLLDQVRKPSR